MKIQRQWLPLFAQLTLLTCGFTSARAQENGEAYRWDITSIDFAAGTLNAGGTASATAADGSKITITGSGTFKVDQPPRLEGPRIGSGTSGGGTWVVRDSPSGPFVGGILKSGTYEVTGFVDFKLAPGTLAPLTDRIGTAADGRAGLAILRIRYSDGSSGLLAVHCKLNGSPTSIPTGVSVSKGFVDFYNVEQSVEGVNTNRTIFHALGQQ